MFQHSWVIWKVVRALLQVYVDRPVSRESVFIVKAWLRKRSEKQTQRRHLQGRAVRWTHSHTVVWLSKLTMEKEKWRSFLCLFLKALGYFLLPSSFFPEWELTTPHGFLPGEGGESPRSLQQGFPPPSPRDGRCGSFPADGFLKRKGKNAKQQRKKEKKATSEHPPVPVRLRLPYSFPKELHRNIAGNTLCVHGLSLLNLPTTPYPLSPSLNLSKRNSLMAFHR